jgi:hypothetical protein
MVSALTSPNMLTPQSPHPDLTWPTTAIRSDVLKTHDSNRKIPPKLFDRSERCSFRGKSPDVDGVLCSSCPFGLLSSTYLLIFVYPILSVQSSSFVKLESVFPILPQWHLRRQSNPKQAMREGLTPLHPMNLA